MDPFGLKAIFITCLVFVPLERLFAMHPKQKVFRRGWANDLIFLLLNGMLIKLGFLAIIAGSIFAAAQIVPASVQATVGGMPYWVQIPLVIVLSDLGFYWTHRMFHAVPWLWRFHAIHHSIEELDWLAAARVHPVDQILTKGSSRWCRLSRWASPNGRSAYMLCSTSGSRFSFMPISASDLAPCDGFLLRRSFIIGITATIVRPETRILPVSCHSSMHCSGAFICHGGKSLQRTAWISRCRSVTCLSSSIPSSATG